MDCGHHGHVDPYDRPRFPLGGLLMVILAGLIAMLAAVWTSPLRGLIWAILEGRLDQTVMALFSAG